MRSCFRNSLFIIIAVLLSRVFPANAQVNDIQGTGKNTLPLPNYYKVRNGLPHFGQKINKRDKVTVAFLGGSITYNPGWRPMICDYLREQFPGVEFRFIAAGIPSLGSLPHVFRLQRDVLDSGKVDLLFLEAAVNDRVNGTDSLTQIRDLEGIVRHAKKSNPGIDMVLMEFADPYKNKDYDDGKIPVEVKNHELIADHYQLPSINLAKEVHDKIANQEFGWEKDFKDLHPSPFGQRLYFENIKGLLNDCFKSSLQAHKISNTALPASLDMHSFTNGAYLNVAKARYNSGWQLVANWSPVDSAGTREGFVHIPVLMNTAPEEELTLPFNGTAVGIAVVSGPDAGIISYRVDNGPEKTKDLFTEWSSGLHLPWYLLLGSALSPGNHVLHISVQKQHNVNSKGNVCRIVHFLVNK
ncbi:MAG TPA: SGNH/GDSL hydrolase family protein [Mucilaginibacter sp.]